TTVIVNPNYASEETVEICAGGEYVLPSGEVVSEAGDYVSAFETINGCDSIITTTIILYPGVVAEINASSSLTFCEGESVILTAEPAGLSYLWSTGETTQSIVVYASGAYSVTVTTDDGCFGTSEEVVVIVNPLPEGATVDIDGETSACEGECVTLTAMPDAQTYEWSTGATTQSIEVCESGVYSVTVTNDFGCSAAIDDIEIIINENPVCSISGDLQICGDGSSVLSGPYGYAYLWSTGETTQSIEVSVAGVYSLTITNEAGCSSTCEVEITVGETPACGICPECPLQFCAGESIVLQALESYAYLWSTGATTQQIIVTEGGWYTVTVFNEEGCSSSCDIYITEIPAPDPTITVDGELEICAGESVTLTAADGYSYIWSTGATT
ncbi:MAG: hypothetical protein ACK4ON_13555, partial [Bacteroidia bacterium]